MCTTVYANGNDRCFVTEIDKKNVSAEIIKMKCECCISVVHSLKYNIMRNRNGRGAQSMYVKSHEINTRLKKDRNVVIQAEIDI